jgi:hypothetical protein
MVTNGNATQFVYSIPYAKILLICLTIVVIGLIFYLILRILAIRDLLQRKTAFLELTPPAFSKKTPEGTEQLFNTLYSLGISRSHRDRLNLRSNIYSFEVVSTRTQGIRFVVRLPANQVNIFKQQVAAYLPDVRYKTIKDYLPKELDSSESTRIMEFALGGHYAYPLASHESLSQHDPIAYITGSMTKLKPDELIALQVVLSPARPHEAKSIQNKLLAGKSPSLSNKAWALPLKLIRFVLRLTVGLLWGILETITGTGKHSPQPTYPPQAPTPAAQAIIDSVHGKLRQPLFRASIRAVVMTEDSTRRSQSATAVVSSLGAFGVPGHQSISAKRNSPRKLLIPYRWFSYRNRLPALLHSSGSVLSLSEVASLYHFPYGNADRTENMVRSLSRTLPAPVSLKKNADTKNFDVVFGENDHHGTKTPIGITAAERERHLYIIGGTGNGKTTMLQYAIVQDMQKGKGVAIVDPHGDLAETMLRHVPKDRIKDVVYFNPDDLDFPIGLNLLELTPGLTGNALLREKDLITESVVSVFRKIFSDEDTGGHRIEYVLRNAIHTALTVEGATLFTVLKLLQNNTYRKEIVDKLEDEDLKDFWKNELGKAGHMQRVKMSVGITAKIGRFKSNAAARLILSQEKSTIDFEDMINSGKILICNFSKGLLGEDVSELFGITTLAKLQLASLRRARIQQAERRPFYLYVDEFQNFATPSFVQMLSESRKYKLFMTMAEQSTSQQIDQQMVNVILANVGSVICFRTGNPADERLMLPLFTPFIEEGEIANLSAYDFYAKLSSIKAQEPLSGQTVLLENLGSEATAKQVIDFSRATYSQVLNYKGRLPAKGKSKAFQSNDVTSSQTEAMLHEELPEYTS